MRKAGDLALLARWAMTWLSSSAVLAFAILILMLSFGLEPARIFRDSVNAARFVGFVASYAVSIVCLSKVRKPGSSESLRLWLISLAGICVPLAILAFGLKAGSGALLIGMAESVAVVLHLAAIAIIALRRRTEKRIAP